MGVLWNHRFNVNPIIPGIPSPNNVAEQTIDGPAYYFEGAQRPASNWYMYKYSLEGEGVFWDARGEHLIPAGSGFLCRINDPETGYKYPADGTGVWHIFYFTFQGGDELVNRLLNRFGPVYHLDSESAPVKSMLTFKKQAGRSQEMLPGQGMAFVTGFLGGLADAAIQEMSKNAAAWLVSRLRRTVQSNLEQNLSVTDVAAILRVTPEHLCRVFKQETGMTPLTYITRERIRRACDLLRDPAKSGKEVCGRLRFDNSSHFARTFRRVTGMTPSEYRRRGGIVLT
ncbi:MAG: helix-turn-helix domain-containing protein [Kiritimatiellia bacterium]|nr:AraC family transcriptional regulator [Lentisphaerota bacterium]